MGGSVYASKSLKTPKGVIRQYNGQK
jgi:hypothetical protein